MEISREVFWNIEYGLLVYVGLLLPLLIGYAIYRRYSLWKLGKAEDRFEKGRIKAFITEAIGILLHKRLLGIGPLPVSPRELYAGTMHFLIFWGMVLLLVVTALVAVHDHVVEFMHGTPYLVISFLGELGGILALAGIIMAGVRRYVQRPDRLDSKLDDAVTLALLFLLVVTGFVLEALRISATVPTPEWERWSFIGFGIASVLGMEKVSLLPWHKGVWWFHVIIFYGAAIYFCLSWSKLFHIIVSPVNIFFRSLRPKGALAPIEGLEEAESFGVEGIKDFTWKQLLDLDSCANCGRCQDNCPAYLSGKPLSPKKLIQDMKISMEEAGNGHEEEPRALIGEVIPDDDIWACTTCRACQEVCPVCVEHIDKIIEMRRNLTLTQSRMPEALEAMVGNLFSRGHPWTGAQFIRLRGDWMEGLDLNMLGEKKEIDTLFWVGCTGALADRNAEVTRSVARILQSAGVEFAVIGAEEACCGDPSRRIGFEILFHEQVQQNIETFRKNNVKRIITACPHCFNTIKNEYPQYGGEFEVLHHTQVLADLLRNGKLKTGGGGEFKRITYHDPCYLGRHNNIYSDPRYVLDRLALPDVIEMSRFGRHARCCGGGGGRIWMEEPVGTKINRMRTEDAIETGAELVITACPFCLQMFEEGIGAKGPDNTALTALDIVEVVEKGLA